MSRAGQPIRFLALVLGGWLCVRVALIYAAIGPVPAPAVRGDDIVNFDFGSAIPPPLEELRPGGARVALPLIELAGVAGFVALPPADRNAPPHRAPGVDPARIALAALGFVQLGYSVPVENAPPPGEQSPAASPSASPAAPVLVPLAAPVSRQGQQSRWSGNAWLIARGGVGIDPGLRGGQLGGGQTGGRLAYALGDARRLALVARIAAPLSGAGREAAFGAEWRPTRLPVRLVAEQRVALGRGNGGGGPSVAIIGGAGPAAIGHGFRLEGYGEAGFIKRALVEGFADGAVRVDHPLGRLGPVALGAGVGSWGAAQRGAARLDIGPTLGAEAPVSGKSLRPSLDWRQRIAGEARPGSGVALSLGVNF